MIISLPQEVSFVIDTLTNANYKAYVVGGFLRDTIMGRLPMDYDVATSAKPEEIKALFEKTLDIGIKHGTITVIYNNCSIEVTTFRIDGPYIDSRHPEKVFFTEDIIKDLSRRDFTINAIAYNTTKGLVDPFKGMDDIKDKIIRCVGEPNLRFKEDALRILRCIRFSTCLGFDIEKDTYEAVCQIINDLRKISSERIREEFTKILLSEKASKGINILNDTGFFKVFSQFSWLQLKSSEKFIDFTEAVLSLRISCIFFSLKQDKAVNLSAAKSVCRFLKYDNKTINEVISILEITNDLPRISDKLSFKKLLNKYNFDVVSHALKLCYAYGKAYEDSQLIKTTELLKSYLIDIEEKKEPIYLWDLAITGEDLIRLGYTKGISLGEELKRLMNLALENPENNKKEILLDMVKVPGITNVK